MLTAASLRLHVLEDRRDLAIAVCGYLAGLILAPLEVDHCRVIRSHGVDRFTADAESAELCLHAVVLNSGPFVMRHFKASIPYKVRATFDLNCHQSQSFPLYRIVH